MFFGDLLANAQISLWTASGAQEAPPDTSQHNNHLGAQQDFVIKFGRPRENSANDCV